MARNNRPTGVFKRQPEINPLLKKRYAALSKADLCDVTFDILKEFYPEWDGTKIMEEIESRHKILLGYRNHEAKQS